MAVLHFLRLPHWATSFGWVALSLYFAFYLPLFVGLSRVAVHRLRVPVILAAPVVWTGLELARAHLLTGNVDGQPRPYPISLDRVDPIERPGRGLRRELCGHVRRRGAGRECSDGLQDRQSARRPISASPAGNTRHSESPRLLLPAIAVLAAALLYGHLRIERNSTKAGPRIALIQGSIDTEMRYDPGMRDRIFKEYYDLSQRPLRRTGTSISSSGRRRCSSSRL